MGGDGMAWAAEGRRGAESDVPVWMQDTWRGSAIGRFGCIYPHECIARALIVRTGPTHLEVLRCGIPDASAELQPQWLRDADGDGSSTWWEAM
ncbi:hypothetical protein VTK73DRAFT_5683 [Phialemonium thermophilum]|uniref:Uncharacterized protein n=1 Tax=Phialemonium thermophilum TaxID=223376 RepID=A0ABR3V1C6_9PEZI